MYNAWANPIQWKLVSPKVPLVSTELHVPLISYFSYDFRVIYSFLFISASLQSADLPVAV